MSAGVKITWHGDKLQAAVKAEMRKRLRLCGELVASRVRENISHTSRPNPSLPGGFPHADTGKLRQSIFSKVIDDSTAIIGTPLKHGLYLEFGTSKMAARPFLRATLSEMSPRIKSILTAPMPGGK